MRKVILAALAAATGLMPSAADAQKPIVRDGPHPVPDVRIHSPRPQAGASWQSGPVMHAGPRHNVSRHRGDRRIEHVRTGHRRGLNRYPGYRMINRGGFVPSYWASPSYGISNFGMYGFGQPMGGARWVRYYDDALMVGPDGRVMDGRYGMEWDRYGERWDHDDRGIPVYEGDRDYHQRDRDYAWSDRFDREDDGDLAYDRDYPYEHPYGGEGLGDYGYGGHGGYGFGGYTVTETVTTTTGPSTVRYVDAPAKKRYTKVKRHYPARRPYRAKSAARCVCR